jgi:ribosomal-protein-alanine N-acetyltransferase
MATSSRNSARTWRPSVAIRTRVSEKTGSAGTGDGWRRALPVLSNDSVTLRGLLQSDAPHLHAQIARPAVTRYLKGSPQTVQELRSFIRWTHTQRRQGGNICYGIVPAGQERAVGLVQIWPVERDFSTAEWGFVIGESYWGSGLFVGCAQLLLDFAFRHLGVRRLESRAVDLNVRGNGVLRKLGATREGVLRAGFRNGAESYDHVMWSILASEWAMHR